MNILDETLAKFPMSEVVIKTSIGSYAVIERVEFATKPMLIKKQNNQYFTFSGTYKANYFKIQSHLRNPDGNDAFPSNSSIRIAFVRIPLNLETSPIFYGRVFDDDQGSVLRGHFGFPFPALLSLGVMILLVIGKIYPNLSEFAFGISLVMIVWAIFSLIEFFTERKGIIDFLRGLFFDVVRTK